MKLSSSGPRPSEQGRWSSFCSPAVLFAPFLTHRACVSALKCRSGSSGDLRGPPLRPGLAACQYGCRGGAGAAFCNSVASMIDAAARDPRFNGKPRSEDHRGHRLSPACCKNGNGASHRAQVQRGRGSKTGCNPTAVEGARSSFGVPLPEQQTLEGD